jgi:hypothetical protein
LKSSYKSVYATLCNATSVLEASNAVLLKFERPADQSAKVQSKRASYGQQYYDKHAVVAQPVVKPTLAPDFTSMKYSTSNPPLKCIMKNSTNYKSTGKMAIKGILWHSTGANNPTLRRYV